MKDPRSATALALVTLAILLAPTHDAPAATGYLRYPDVHRDRLVFCAEGDLWVTPAQGGLATHLTSHPGQEYFPRFSPDGTMIAFTGIYDGNVDAFVMPSLGGEPVRLTWAPGADEVLGWTPEGDILFRSRRDSPHTDWQPYAVSPRGGDARLMPTGRASRLSIDPESGMWAINRTDRERATWKRYRGGTQAEIWVGRPDGEFKKVTDFTGHDMMPMWHGGRIWFLCDEGGTQEVWSMFPDGSDRTRHTHHGNWDARYAEMGEGGRIVYQLAGDIGLYDIASGQDRRLVIELPSESILTRERYPDASKFLTEFDLSPKGDRLAIVARGEVFSVPVEEGVTLCLTSGSGARERGAAYGAEGDRLYLVSDETGEEEIRAIDANGRAGATRVKPAGESGWHFAPAPSPDGSRVAWADEDFTLWVAPAKGGTAKKVDRSEQEEIREYAWSPDGRFLAYTKSPRTDFRSIFVWDSKDASTHRVTGDETIDFSPTWDPDGRWLAFLSRRVVNPVVDDGRDFQNLDIADTKPYLVLLRADARSPFEDGASLPGQEDAEKKDEKEDSDKAKGGKGKKGDKGADKKKAEPVKIDWEGLGRRVVDVPVDPGMYRGLGATASHLYWFSGPVRGIAETYDEDEPSPTNLVSFDLEEEEEKVFAKGVTAYDVEPGAEKIAFQKKKGEIFVVEADAEAPEDLEDSTVSLADVVIDLHPRDEWRQMYYEGWRNMRDFHWTPDFAGVDWKEVRDRYASLIPRLAIRDDLRDLLGEVIGELATSHTYVYGGDPGIESKSVPTGLLGARVTRVGSAYRITKVLRGDPADLDRSALEEPGVNVREGEFIVAVNRRPFPPDRPFEAAFANLAERRVLLTVAKDAKGGGARDVVVTTIADDTRLRYIDWVRTNREAVLAATNGRVGYIHLPDMGSDGLVEFNRWFYPQLDKEAMIVDCRWNGGGYVSQMLVERLRRKVVSWDRSRGGGVYSYPYRTLRGPFIVLTNEQAGSDGDIFPYVCQYEGLAKVLGERSWGGVVGIRSDKPLVDGGMLTQPEYAWWDERRGWAMENHGVDPDIVVVETPQDAAQARDVQLQRGVEEILRELAASPAKAPTFAGEIPNKSRAGFLEREGKIR